MPSSVRRAYTPIPFPAVKIDDPFWSPRLKVNREQTIPTEYQQLKETGRIDAFRLQWKPGDDPIPHFFWDSDVAKWIEAASYSLAVHPDPALDALLDDVITLIASAQQPDGYLNVYFTVVEPTERFTDLRDAHELYCAGHLIEAAVAHYQATGKRTLLDPMCRYADLIGKTFGSGEGQKRGYSGHEEIELALVKLYHATGEQRYLDLSRYLVDERGQKPHYFDLEAEELHKAGKRHHSEDYFERFMGTEFDYHYNQSHQPVREQSVVGGHAVRAMYLFSAMADLAGETGDSTLLAACERLWNNLCGTRMYVTGGIGSASSNEGFSGDYDLPNETAYAETCAAVGFIFWNHRMLLLTGDRRYADVMERTLYNGAISGISLDGKSFFYENPLASLGNRHRQTWFSCSCCPPNIARLLASLGEYIYSVSEEDIAVHLYAGNEASLRFHDQQVTLKQETRYPWQGQVRLTLQLERPDTFSLKLRVPGWCPAARVQVNGETVDTTGPLERGYLRIQRQWRSGDEVLLDMEMPVERVYANPKVRQDTGRVAVQRGPVVYCFEQVDQQAPLEQIRLPRDVELAARFEPDLLGGVTTIQAAGRAADESAWEGNLYQSGPQATRPMTIKAVPYYAWDNRAPGAMQVWIPEI